MALCLRMWWRRNCWQKDLRSITLIAKSREKGVFAYLYDYVSGRGNTGTDHISFGFAWIGGSLMNTNYEHIVHPFPPLYDEASKILILGSLPSVKSREQMFFYGHPQNRFWKVMAAVLQVEVPISIDEKKKMLHENHIALWDTIYSCDIIGSSDSSIRNVTPSLSNRRSKGFTVMVQSRENILRSTSRMCLVWRRLRFPPPARQMRHTPWNDWFLSGSRCWNDQICIF